jgi:hypothetical protein
MNEEYLKDAERLSTMAKEGSKSMKRKATIKEEMLTAKEKELRRRKKSREVVTSENREEYMAKKLKLANKQEPVYKEE